MRFQVETGMCGRGLSLRNLKETEPCFLNLGVDLVHVVPVVFSKIFADFFGT